MELIAKKKKKKREGATRTVQSYKVNPSLLKKMAAICLHSIGDAARSLFFVLMS